MSVSPDRLAALCLILTLLHSFSVGVFARLSKKFSGARPIPYRLFYLLSEVEFVFILWALIFLALRIPVTSLQETIGYLSGIHFSEALFVTLAMLMASTRPVMEAARVVIEAFSQRLPLPGSLRGSRIPLLFSILVLAPLSGSLMTEPAAMTVGALLLQHRILGKQPSGRLLYSVLAALFVNVSIGGVLSAFAAPPVLVVARTWDWDTPFMLRSFAWKTLLAVMINAGLTCFINRNELLRPVGPEARKHRISNPILLGLNLGFLTALVMLLSHPIGLLGTLALLLPYLYLTREEQGDLQPLPAIGVGGFLAGLLVITSAQGWWLNPILQQLDGQVLFLGASLLTAVTDNAALTALAAQVPDLSPSSRYLVVAGAVTGGGLTLIANAPNPAGFALLKHHFQKEGFRALRLLGYAALPTLIAGGLLWIH
jgi:hypothetical protein